MEKNATENKYIKIRKRLMVIIFLFFIISIAVVIILISVLSNKSSAVTFSSIGLPDKVTVLADDKQINSGDSVKYGTILTINFEDIKGYDTIVKVNNEVLTPKNDGTYIYKVNISKIDIVVSYDVAQDYYLVIFKDYDNNVIDSKVLPKGQIIIPPPNPARQNTAQYTYTFISWDGYTQGMTVTADITFTAQYNQIINQYTVTFDSDGGSDILPITQDYGTAITKPIDPEKDMYAFMGWYIDEEFMQLYDFSNHITKDFTLYAKWLEIHDGLLFIPINDGTEYSVKWYDNSDDTIYIPNTLNEKYITAIADEGFKNCPATYIFCDDGYLNSIGKNAFNPDTLVGLYIFKNQLTSIDLNGLTQLTTLVINNNLLTSIDLSGLTQLTSLVIINNLLTSINLEGFDNLANLNLANNNLTSIDLSGLSSIEYFNLDDNNLSSIDLNLLSKNLSGISLNSNNLTSVDLSVLNDGLESLSLSYNQIETIDISRFTALKSFYIYDNKISSIDLSQNKDLLNLGLGSNQLTSVDLSGLSELRFLSLSNNQLSFIDLSGLTKLQTVYLSDNLITSIDLSGLTNLLDVYLRNNLLTSINLTGTTKLRMLYLQNNLLSAEELAKIKTSSLYRYDFSGNPGYDG